LINPSSTCAAASTHPSAILSLRGPGGESATANLWERLSAAIGRPLSLARPQVAAISRSHSCVLNQGRPRWTGAVPKWAWLITHRALDLTVTQTAQLLGKTRRPVE